MHGQDTYPSHAWVREVLLESASTTLEKVVLDCYPRSSFNFDFGLELDFSNFIHLRTLTTECSSLIEELYPPTSIFGDAISDSLSAKGLLNVCLYLTFYHQL